MEDKKWMWGWEKGYSDGFKDAIDKLLEILEKSDLKKVYEEIYRGKFRK